MALDAGSPAPCDPGIAVLGCLTRRMPPLLALLLPLSIDLAPLEQRAKSALIVADFDAAAAAMEALAEAARPAGKRAAEALGEATLLRLGLDQIAQADADLARFERAFGRAHPALHARLVLARARVDLDAEAFEPARARLAARLPQLDRAASVEQRIELHGLLAQALLGLDRGKEAASERRAILALARSPAARALGSPAREVIAEARFAFAEEKRAEAERITLPPYRGPSARDPILKYVELTLAPWLIRRRYAIELAENAYDRVLGIERKPPPPPRPPPPPGSLIGGDPEVGTAWNAEPLGLEGSEGLPSPRFAVASAARVGGMWSALRAELRGLPFPPPPPGLPAELRPVYQQSFHNDFDDTTFINAKRAFARCLDWATTYRIANEDSVTCERWLGLHARYEYPPNDALWDDALRPSPPALPSPILR